MNTTYEKEDIIKKEINFMFDQWEKNMDDHFFIQCIYSVINEGKLRIENAQNRIRLKME